MKLHRFYIESTDFSKLSFGDSFEINNLELAHQLSRVLRFKDGDELVLFDDIGPEYFDYLCMVKSIKNNVVELMVKSKSENHKEPKKQVTLFCAVLKKDNFALVVEKVVELGVFEIRPIITARTIKDVLRLDRLAKIAKEATEQSGRAMVPKIHAPISFKEAMNTTSEFNQNIFFDISDVNRQHPPSIIGDLQSISIFIGPEGGWSPEEIALAKTAKLNFMSLSPLTLRAETAAIVGVHMVVDNSVV